MSIQYPPARFKPALFELEFAPTETGHFRRLACISILVLGGGLTIVWALGLLWLVGYALACW